jgi:hypothetical protein
VPFCGPWPVSPYVHGVSFSESCGGEVRMASSSLPSSRIFPTRSTLSFVERRGIP